MYHDMDREERSSMIEMTEAEYGVLGEEAEAEYGICDLLDENIPSPLETDNAGETLVLPEIQDMTEYIRRHYEQEIMKKLAWRLRWEELCVVSDGRHYQDLPWTGPEDYGEEASLPGPEDIIPKDFDDPRFADEKTRYATLQPKEVKIVFASYYRVSECCVEARLTVEAQVEIRWRFLGKTVPQRYDVDMWFDMEGDMNGEICQIALHRYRSEASGVKLDEYLVPVFHWEDIEEEAERIIADLVPEGLSDPSRLRPYPFAERLGLKIVSLPLYKRPKTASILFFGPGEVLTGSSADAPSVSVAVEANTIVLNSHLSGREKDAIFHECFHYVEHRLFFKLQQLHNNDIAAIGRWRPVTLKEGRRSPIEWIEWQANVGSQCLQVPQALLRKCVNEALNDMKNMRTRKTNSASNAKSSAASQEYYENTYNYVGIVHFAGMALSGKVITGISLRIVAAQAGYGTGHTKTVYVRKSNYQSASQSGITGLGYCGDALGTFTGAFYGNTSTYTLSGDLLNNLAAYIAEGNNTICLYNPSPVKSSQGYSTNYLQWSECTITVTYEEAASKPTLNKYSLAMGTAVTVYTNRQSSIATHTVRYSFFSESGLIAVGVEDVCTWTPPVSLAAQIPNATSGWGTILCDTYVNGNLVSTNTCAFQLTVPASVVPSISNVAFSEAASGVAERFGGYVRTRSKSARRRCWSGTAA